MKAYLLASGEVLYPRTVSGRGLLGDGWGLAGPTTAVAQAWKAFTVRAAPMHEALAAKLRAAPGE